jgi:bacillithiol biosynthesis cysteine-adding enzyme BshC
MSCNFLHTLPLRSVGDNNKLYVDYAEDPQSTAGGSLQGFAADVSVWRGLAATVREEAARKRGPIWEDVIQDVLKTSDRAGTSRLLLQKLEMARDQSVLFVITGQQPGLLGGPLLTVYKALTAIAFADWLEDRLSTPVIPLFWIAADDTDFAEIRSLFIVSPDMSPLSTSLSDKAHHPGLPVGDIKVEFASESWAGVSTFIQAFPNGDCVREWTDRALSRTRDHAEVFAKIVSALAGGKLVFVDGRSGPVRRCSKRLMSDYVDREEDVKKMVIAQGERLRQIGYHAQLSPGMDSGIFLLEDGKRHSVPPDRIADLRDAMEHSIESCSPGVILRNLVQDYVFRPIAVVLGPAETAYRAQIADAYRSFNIPRPSVIPRLTATYIPPPLAELLSGSDADGYETLIREPSRFAAAMYERCIPARVRSAVEAYADQVTRAADDMRRAVDGTIPAKMQKRLAGRLADIQRRAEQLGDIGSEAGKLLALERHPHLAHLGAAMRPDDKPQERVLSCLVPFLFAGERAMLAIREASRRHLAELMDGTPCHIVYSV